MRRNEVKDEDYLDYIREQPCCICGHKSYGDKPTGKPHHSAAHHVNGRWNDYDTVPLCDFKTSSYGNNNCHHDTVHKKMKHYRPILTKVSHEYRLRYIEIHGDVVEEEV